MNSKKIYILLLAFFVVGFTVVDHIQDWKIGNRESEGLTGQMSSEFTLKIALAEKSLFGDAVSDKIFQRIFTELGKDPVNNTTWVTSSLKQAILYGYRNDPNNATAILTQVETRASSSTIHLTTREKDQLNALLLLNFKPSITHFELKKIQNAFNSSESMYARLVFIQAYQKAGMKSEAMSFQENLENEGVQYLTRFSAFLGMFFLLGILGIVLDLYFVFSWQQQKIVSYPSVFSGWDLLAGFLIWMTATWLIGKIPFERVIHHNIQHISKMLIPAMTISILFNFLCLVIAFAYLAKSDISWRIKLGSIGLHTQNFMKNLLYGLGTYIGTIPLLLIALMITTLVSGLFKHIPTPPNSAIWIIQSAHSNLSKIMVLLLISIAAPVIEETLFRGFLYTAFKQKWGPIWGAVLSSALFASLHQQLPLGFFPIFALGISFSIVRERENSLIPSMVAHGLNNGLLFLLYMLSR